MCLVPFKENTAEVGHNVWANVLFIVVIIIIIIVIIIIIANDCHLVGE